MAGAYPAPERRKWNTQIEFFDGTVIDAADDDDAIARWRRVATWSDPTAQTDPSDWMARVLDRARVVYAAKLRDVSSDSSPTKILDALSDEGCLYLRRR